VSQPRESQIERFAPGFRERVLARHVRSVAQMEAHNVNYVGGDVVTGSNDPRRSCFGHASRSIRTPQASPVSTCAQRPRRPARAPTARAATTRPAPRYGG
jgi:phytoene dehydrogenase-like protein